MNLLGDISFQKLQAGVQAANTRQRVIANNISNVDTPYFKRSEVSFEELLQQQMDGDVTPLRGKVTNARHFQIGPVNSIPDAMVTKDGYSVMNNNMNNVDVDREMSLMAENQLRYNAYIQEINERIKMMRTAVEGR
ncbi:flagellar basal body rod protein FlgB [Paenibacillus kribbensis]|uniref:Flagellar basal body rod protein FlgB n=1 Tax=Paenibacillus kribbensis TaxID=172713 RepID=A0A222WQC8_9BACL|nr:MULTISPECIES: flagellar basal body rod protein FlgB [Paenibacillus]ASR47973.1 flagellar basal-body rod protein FlgB [Paenibacillus kribbensis]EHS57864.1 flagellar basal-body rod protein FlgB [Paenibacillus sp. Aloe-11]MEC0235818.1 flagellar basal body rod protein FlgB [Paenibacillus kribbensis]